MLGVVVLAVVVVNLFALSRIFLTTDSSIIEVNRQHRQVYNVRQAVATDISSVSLAIGRGRVGPFCQGTYSYIPASTFFDI